MTFIWLIVWLCNSTPALHQWNNWAIALVVCLAIDLIGGIGGKAAS